MSNVTRLPFFDRHEGLGEAAGYAIILGFGGFFSLFTTFVVHLMKKYSPDAHLMETAEYFNSGGRDIKTGLTASVIVSQWTWAATLLQSSNVAYQYGVSGPFWYASGASIQVLLFGILAIELKRRAPGCHTMVELVGARWGDTAHKVFLVFALVCNMLVTSMLLLGGGAVVNALTGVDTNLACFLIPIGVIVYTYAGGLKATFIASYIHTAIIFLVLTIFIFLTYASSSTALGSPSIMYDKLQLLAGNATTRVEGNEGGSYLTMLSSGGLMFGIINIVGNFGTVFCDQSYWQSAIAANPASAHKGYLLGGMVWFTIPFALATSLGLASRALDLGITADEAGAGLVPPAVAMEYMGNSGGVLILTMLFMAITSTGSAELIAVSSLLSYDVYLKYVNPEATGVQILSFGRKVIVLFGLFMGTFAVILNAMGLSLGWVYLFMGICIGSAVVPVFFVLLWPKATTNGVLAGAILGLISALVSWLITCQAYTGEITIKNLGTNEPMLVGNLFAILFSGIVTTVVSTMEYNKDPTNEKFTWPFIEKQFAAIKSPKGEAPPPALTATKEELLHARKWITKWGVGLTLLIIVVWPLASVPAGVFTKGYFTFWVAISLIWGCLATAIIVILPIWESKDGLLAILQCKKQKPLPITNPEAQAKPDTAQAAIDRWPDDKAQA